MGSDHSQLDRPCLHVYVIPTLRLRLHLDVIHLFLDYYYYATAGGARIWVRIPKPLFYVLWPNRTNTLDPVEDIPYYYANCSIHH